MSTGGAASESSKNPGSTHGTRKDAHAAIVFVFGKAKNSGAPAMASALASSFPPAPSVHAAFAHDLSLASVERSRRSAASRLWFLNVSARRNAREEKVRWTFALSSAGRLHVLSHGGEFRVRSHGGAMEPPLEKALSWKSSSFFRGFPVLLAWSRRRATNASRDSNTGVASKAGSRTIRSKSPLVKSNSTRTLPMAFDASGFSRKRSSASRSIDRAIASKLTTTRVESHRAFPRSLTSPAGTDSKSIAIWESQSKTTGMVGTSATRRCLRAFAEWSTAYATARASAARSLIRESVSARASDSAIEREGTARHI